MRRLLLVAVLGALASAEARADGWPRHIPRGRDNNHAWGPHTTSVTWPSVVPPGWYSNTYNYRWFYPWFAYYDYTSSPYANWPATAGVAGYSYHGPAGIYHYPREVAQPYYGAWFNGNDPAGPYQTLQGLSAPAYPLAAPPAAPGTVVPKGAEPPKDMPKDKPKD